MAKFDLIGLGNALVDSEFHVTDSFLKKKGFEKGKDDVEIRVT